VSRLARLALAFTIAGTAVPAAAQSVGAATAAGTAAASAAAASGEMHKDSLQASIVRGAVAFNTNCVLCHGSTATGNGRAARLYNPPPTNLTRTPHNDDYLELIIRRGGAGMARSEFMPPWGEQLTDEQIRDIVRYVRSLARRD
jgi:mono/diheme cytochrome c family protein